MDTAQEAPDTLWLAGDEASLYLQASRMRVFAPIGQTPVVPDVPGRENPHFYGALNLATGAEVVLRSDLMNAEVSALFLQQLLAAYPHTPIVLLWDRAPWHHGEAIGSVLAANTRLEIVWWPAACPELNPQEHVWKAVREAVSPHHTYTKLSESAQAFETYLGETKFPCSLLDKHDYHNFCARFI